MTEKQKMLSSKLYDISDEELVKQYNKTRRLVRAFNATPDSNVKKKSKILIIKRKEKSYIIDS